MTDINYSQTPGSYNLQTAAGQGYSTPGYGGADWGQFFDLAAQRKAQAQAEEKRRYDQEFAMRQQMQNEQLRQGRVSEAGQRSVSPQMGPQEEWTDVPAMKGLAFGVNSAPVRVRAGDPAAQYSMGGVRGY